MFLLTMKAFSHTLLLRAILTIPSGIQAQVRFDTDFEGGAIGRGGTDIPKH